MSNQYFEKVIAKILEAAKSHREAAGMSGSWEDGGAHKMEEQVKYFKFGYEQTLPPDWKPFAIEVDKDADPEYSEYLRLKDKFKEK